MGPEHIENTFFTKHLPDLQFDQKYEILWEDVEVALDNTTMKVYDVCDMLVLLTSLNLLNAAIKQKEFKDRLKYQIIKGHLTRVLGYCIIAKKKKFLDDIYINTDENYCAYVRCMGLHFSFHNISLNDTIRSFTDSTENVIKKWDGIRLQPIAPILFKKALELKLKSMSK